MPGIGFDLAALLDHFRTTCRTTGGFDNVVTHELRKAPTNKFVLGAWLATLDPVAERSGLSSTSLRVELQARIYVPMAGDPDNIDTEIARRVDLIWARFHETLMVDGHEIDILGAFGERMRARMGWLPMDNTVMRVNDILVPIIVDDAYTQERE
jgi:hypothetical protein